MPIGTSNNAFFSVSGIALPNTSVVPWTWSPFLSSKCFTAFSTDDFAGKWIFSNVGRKCFDAVRFHEFFSAFFLKLNCFPYLWLYDCRMTICHIILRNLSLILITLLCNEVYGVSFLKQCISLILFIMEHLLNRTGDPFNFSIPPWNFGFIQFLCNTEIISSTQMAYMYQFHQ